MGTNPNGEQEAAKREQEALPVTDPASSPAPVPTVQTPIPPTVKETEVSGESEQDSDSKPDNSAANPLFISVLRDKESSPFERKTIFWGRVGVVLAFLSLMAAIGAGFVFYWQFQQMATQTGILSNTLAQAKLDSESNDTSTAAQLKTLQGQLTQQRQALEVDQRPWLKFELEGTVTSGTDPNGTSRTIPFVAEQPMKVPVRITNIGKTVAEQATGVLDIQIIQKGKHPHIPKGQMKLAVTADPGEPPAPGRPYPGRAWMESTIYPGGVSESSPTRMKKGPDGKRFVDDLLTQSEVDGINKGTAYIYVVGEVWYSDIFGVRHWTKFCESNVLAATADRLKCARFGTVDNNHADDAKK